MSVSNRTASDENEYNAVEMGDPENLVQIAMAIVGILSVSGTIGNALVLYVFARQKQKLSSTIFILTLACTDFVSSLVTMPYTIAVELLKYKVEYDAVCKVYQFLVTTTIPFSAFVMVAIAVDRYLCIVHPFKHTMTLGRAKVVVALLALLATTLGLLCCLMYGVHWKEVYCVSNSNATSDVNSNSNTTSWSRKVSSAGQCNDTEEINISIVNKGLCHKDLIIFDASFFNVYQKIYSAFFAICAVVVIVLYAIIYRSVLTRRRKRLHLTKKCCGFWAETSAADTSDVEHTEFTTLNNGSKERVTNGDSPKMVDKSPQTELKPEMCKTVAANKGKLDTDALVRPSGVSRAKLEKLRMANIKTALMLSIVALIYIVAFMPAWLMAHQVLTMNVVIFYLYFTYSVANPIIYAFLNQSFRNHLQTLVKCRK